MLPNWSEIISFWERDQLWRWDENLLRARGLSSETSEYLSTVGLPRVNDWSFTVDQKTADLPPVQGQPALITVGLDAVVPICIDTAGNERVVLYDEEATPRVMFASSSIEHFGAALYLFRKIGLGRPEDGSKDREVATELFRQIHDWDEAAVCKPGQYWTWIIAQVFDGRL